MSTTKLPDWHKHSLQTISNEQRQAKLQAMVNSHNAAMNLKRPSLALPAIYNVPLDEPAVPIKTKASSIPARPVLTTTGANRKAYVAPAEPKLDLTKDDMDIFLLTQENGFSQVRMLTEALGRSVDAVRKRMNSLTAAGFLEQVKGPYQLPIYRLTAQGVKCLNFDAQMPIRNFNPFDDLYTRRCHIGGLVSEIYGIGSNKAVLGSDMPDGRLAVLGGTRIMSGVLQVKAAGHLSIQQLRADQRDLEMDLKHPQAAGAVPTSQELLSMAPEMLAYWQGSIHRSVESGIWPRAYTFASIDREGIWVPDYVMPLPMNRETGRFSSIAGIVRADFETEPAMVRDIRSLYLTNGAVRCNVHCASAAIAEAYRQCLLEMEASGRLPFGANKFFTFVRLTPRNYTGKGEDRLTTTGALRATTGFHG